MIEIVSPGALSTVQDVGRRSQGAFGVPPSGAMDELALRIANRLVGNRDDAAAIEVTLAGPELRFEDAAIVAIAGSRFDGTLEGRPLPHAEPFRVPPGVSLAIGKTREGARAVVAIAGGIDVPIVLGSRATFVRGGFGGHAGRLLRAGDRLSIAAPGVFVRRRVRERALAPYDARAMIRVVAGPQAEAFTERGWRTFLESPYAVTPRSDRMGLRLSGPAIEHAGLADLAPEGIAPGAIQVPGDGEPIVLGADRPTTGGYVKIATVIGADLWRVGQAKPGDVLRFETIDVDVARALLREQQEVLRSAVEELR
jgi:biotin-dependent carboxylase-like uncharacterized protein